MGKSNIPQRIADEREVESDGEVRDDGEQGKESNLDLQENDDSDDDISDQNFKKSNGKNFENYEQF